MSNNRSIRNIVTALTAALVLSAFAAPGEAARRDKTIVAAADCYAIGQRVAQENGGTLARAQASEQGGQQVCVIVVLVPGKEGQRPRRAEFVVPAN
jgi:hypothetical protein